MRSQSSGSITNLISVSGTPANPTLQASAVDYVHGVSYFGSNAGDIVSLSYHKYWAFLDSNKNLLL